MKYPFNSPFYTAFLGLVLLFVYALAFYASANTPIAEASFTELLHLIGLGIGVAAIGGFIVAAGCLPLGPLIRFSPLPITLEKTVALLLLFCLCLLVIENWCYSLFSVGLKSGDSIMVKALFIAGSAFMAYKACGALLYGASLLKRIGWPTIVFLALAPQFAIWALSIEPPARSESNGQPPTKGRSVNVLIISADGLNADSMSLYGSGESTTPFLDSIANELMIFENAYANSGNTTGSITAVLTGRSPLTTRVIYPPDILDERHSLHSLPGLIRSDRYLRTQWSIPHFASAYDQGFLFAFDLVHGQSLGTWDELTSKLALTSAQSWFLKSIYRDQMGVIRDAFGLEELDNPYLQVAESVPDRPHTLEDEERLMGLLGDLHQAVSSGRRLFSQVHFMETHGPTFHPGERHFSQGLEQNRPWMSPFYLDSILEFDARVEEIYRALSDAGQLDKTLLVIYSDHGKRWSVAARIPLLIRLPGGESAGRYTPNVQLLDIAPTVAEYLGIAVPSWMTGSSLLKPQALPTDRILYSASVLKAKKGGPGWVRANDKQASFGDANVFTLIHCGTIATAGLSDTEFVFQKLPGNTSSPACSRQPPADLHEKAANEMKQLLNKN